MLSTFTCFKLWVVFAFSFGLWLVVLLSLVFDCSSWIWFGLCLYDLLSGLCLRMIVLRLF